MDNVYKKMYRKVTIYTYIKNLKKFHNNLLDFIDIKDIKGNNEKLNAIKKINTKVDKLKSVAKYLKFDYSVINLNSHFNIHYVPSLYKIPYDLMSNDHSELLFSNPAMLKENFITKHKKVSNLISNTKKTQKSKTSKKSIIQNNIKTMLNYYFNNKQNYYINDILYNIDNYRQTDTIHDDGSNTTYVFVELELKKHKTKDENKYYNKHKCEAYNSNMFTNFNNLFGIDKIYKKNIKNVYDINLDSTAIYYKPDDPNIGVLLDKLEKKRWTKQQEEIREKQRIIKQDLLSNLFFDESSDKDINNKKVNKKNILDNIKKGGSTTKKHKCKCLNKTHKIHKSNRSLQIL